MCVNSITFECSLFIMFTSVIHFDIINHKCNIPLTISDFKVTDSHKEDMYLLRKSCGHMKFIHLINDGSDMQDPTHPT